MKQASKKCITDCKTSIKKCKKLCDTYKNKSKSYAMKECIKTCKCCIILCKYVCEMMKCDEDGAMTKRLANLCAMCCKKCISQCAKFKNDKVCKECITACKKCKTTCLKYSKIKQKGGDGNVTGKDITRRWVSKNNAGVTQCSLPACNKEFGLLTPKHNCKYCGNIFCKTHCSQRLRLPVYFNKETGSNMEYKTAGILTLPDKMSTVCDRCYTAVSKWNEQTTMPKTISNRMTQPAVVKCKICDTSLGGLTQKHQCSSCMKYTCNNRGQDVSENEEGCYYIKRGYRYVGMKYCKQCYFGNRSKDTNDITDGVKYEMSY
jgi:hypothetical protein